MTVPPSLPAPNDGDGSPPEYPFDPHAPEFARPAQYRHVLSHLFHVRAVHELESLISRWATVHLMGWPADGWEQVLLPIKDFTTRVPGTPGRARAAVEVAAIRTRIETNIAVRRGQATDDLASHLIGSTIGSRPLSDDEIVALRPVPHRTGRGRRARHRNWREGVPPVGFGQP